MKNLNNIITEINDICKQYLIMQERIMALLLFNLPMESEYLLLNFDQFINVCYNEVWSHTKS